MEVEEIFEYLETTRLMIKECIRIIRAKGLTNDLRFIEWEDEVNALSVLDHNK